MSHCPECLAEYGEETAECVDCHVPLRAGAPAAPTEPARETKLVRVREFHGPTAQMEADLARNILEQEHIPSVLPGETEVLPGVDVVQLLVREQDAAQASEILHGYLDQQDSAELTAEE